MVLRPDRARPAGDRAPPARGRPAQLPARPARRAAARRDRDRPARARGGRARGRAVRHPSAPAGAAGGPVEGVSRTRPGAYGGRVALAPRTDRLSGMSVPRRSCSHPAAPRNRRTSRPSAAAQQRRRPPTRRTARARPGRSWSATAPPPPRRGSANARNTPPETIAASWRPVTQPREAHPSNSGSNAPSSRGGADRPAVRFPAALRSSSPSLDCVSSEAIARIPARASRRRQPRPAGEVALARRRVPGQIAAGQLRQRALARHPRGLSDPVSHEYERVLTVNDRTADASTPGGWPTRGHARAPAPRFARPPMRDARRADRA